jgi:cell division protein FtsB
MPKVVRRTRASLKAEAKRTNLRAVKALSVSAVLLGFVAIVIFSTVKLDEISRDIAATQSKIDVIKSENTRLDMEINSIVSLNKVEDYAENVLGMVKQESYQIEYVSLACADKVLISGGKNVSDGNNDNKTKKFWNISF